MPLQATVVIPTHDHGPLLYYSVRSALAQTVADLEVFVIGDGVPDITRNVVANLHKSDQRVRFFDNPKGPRNGEIHRHAALQLARGEIVCYLSDDDLWLPHHVETMQRLLHNANFGNALPLRVAPGGALGGWTVDLGLPFYRHLFLTGTNRVPLTCGAHTLSFYRQLSEGWRTSPAGSFSDLHMWQQFLSHPDCRPRSSTLPSTLHFASRERKGWKIDVRVAELEYWTQKLAAQSGWDNLIREVLELVVRERAEGEVAMQTRQQQLEHERVERERQTAHLQELLRKNEQLAQEIALAGDEKSRALAEAENARMQLAAVCTSATWRLRSRLRHLPVGRKVLRSVARLLAGSPFRTASETAVRTAAF